MLILRFYIPNIYNHSCISNLDDGNHIRIILSCSNATETHKANIFHSNLVLVFQYISKIIEYNSNDLEDEDKEPIEFTERKADPENHENSIDFRW